MKNLKVLKSRIFVEKLAKKPSKSEGSLFVEAEVSDSQGTIIAIGEDYKGELNIGDRVYYGREVQQIRMTGKDVLVMDSENVVAIVEESDETLSTEG